MFYASPHPEISIQPNPTHSKLTVLHPPKTVFLMICIRWKESYVSHLFNSSPKIICFPSSQFSIFERISIVHDGNGSIGMHRRTSYFASTKSASKSKISAELWIRQNWFSLEYSDQEDKWHLEAPSSPPPSTILEVEKAWLAFNRTPHCRRCQIWKFSNILKYLSSHPFVIFQRASTTLYLENGFQGILCLISTKFTIDIACILKTICKVYY